MQTLHIYQIRLSAANNSLSAKPNSNSISGLFTYDLTLSQIETEDEEEELISILRKTGSFTNADMEMKFKLSLSKVSFKNPDHQLTICTRFYKDVKDVCYILKSLVRFPNPYLNFPYDLECDNYFFKNQFICKFLES